VLLLEFDAIAIPGAVGWSIALRVALVVVTAVWGLASVVDATRHGWARHVWVAPLDLMVAPAVLILVEPDLGTTLIVLAIAGTIVLFVGVGWRSLALLAVAGVAGAVVAWFKVLREYQKQRVLTFLNPEADALGAGYHANQSMIAIGSGGVQGKGFMEGTQTQLSFLPENHTDFAFSVLAEEWGLFGAAVLLVLFGLLLIKGVRIAAAARDRFGVLLAIGATSVIFWQMLVNVGMVTGLLPVVGVTLPLVSYGGSSVLTVMLAVGVLLSVARRRAVR
jgi:rod shape determining protein RodA